MAGKVFFNSSASRRITNAVKHVERSRKTGQAGWSEYRNIGKKQGGTQTNTFGIGRTTAQWVKGSVQSVAEHDKATRAATGNTVQVYNLFADIEAGKWVAYQDGYLIAAEC